MARVANPPGHLDIRGSNIQYYGWLLPPPNYHRSCTRISMGYDRIVDSHLYVIRALSFCTLRAAVACRVGYANTDVGHNPISAWLTARRNDMYRRSSIVPAH